MSKYIIELEDDIQYVLFNGKADNKYYTAVRPVAELEVLNSDYINEHYGSLQDEAYQRGYEDGKKSIDLGCKDCKYHEDTSLTNPCSECTRAWKDHYTSAPHSDRIEVWDEVIDKDGDTTIVTNIHEHLFDGLCSDGSTMSDLFLEDVRKTGRHYDHIDKLLEAIRA